MPIAQPNVPARPEVLLLDVAETARVLGIGRDRVYELIASGELPSVRLGERTIRVPRDLLSAWVTVRAQGGRP